MYIYIYKCICMCVCMCVCIFWLSPSPRPPSRGSLGCDVLSARLLPDIRPQPWW